MVQSGVYRAHLCEPGTGYIIRCNVGEGRMMVVTVRVA